MFPLLFFLCQNLNGLIRLINQNVWFLPVKTHHVPVQPLFWSFPFIKTCVNVPSS